MTVTAEDMHFTPLSEKRFVVGSPVDRGRVEVLENQMIDAVNLIRALLHHVGTDEAMRLSEQARLMIGEYEQAQVPKL